MPLPPLNEFFLYGFNSQCKLYWIWSLPVSAVWNTSWPRLKESERGPDWWLSGDRFLFPALHASLPGEIMVVSVCQLELSLSLLLQASYSHALLPGRCESKGGAGVRERKRETEGFFFTWHSREAEHQHPSMQLESLKRSKEGTKAVCHLQGASCTVNRQTPHPPPCVGWYSPLGLADRLTRLHGGQANTETDPGRGHRAAVHTPLPGWHWTCW